MICRHVQLFLSALLLVFSSVSRLHAQAPMAAAAQPAVAEANRRIATALEPGSAMTPQLAQLLTARHATMEQVMRTAPASARSYALDPATRAQLLQMDPANAALVEQDIPLTGELGMAIADDFVHHTSTTHYFLHTPSSVRSISFASEPASVGSLVHHQVTLTGLSLPEVVAAETMREASPTDIQPCEPLVPLVPQARVAESRPLRSFAATVAPGAATATCSTTGNQTTAILILNFAGGTATYPTGMDQLPYWQSVFAGPTPSVGDYINETSYGQTTLTADTYGPFTLPGSYDCTTTDGMGTAALAAAQGTVDLTSYNRFILVYPVAACAFAGLGSFPMAADNTVNHGYSLMWVPVTPNDTPTNQPTLWAALSHEFGHNLALNHSNTLDFGALTLGPPDFSATNPGTVTAAPTNPGASSIASNAVAAAIANGAPPTGSTGIGAVNTEYGDNYVIMGNPWSPGGPYTSMHRFQQLGWLDPLSEQDVTTSGNFSIAPLEATTGLRALHVLRDAASDSWIWIDFQQPLGTYESLSVPGVIANVTNYANNTYTTGAVLHYENGFGTPGYTYLLDTTATAMPNNFATSNLVPASTWSDPFSLLTITTGAQTAASLGVTVSYDTPCAAVSLSQSTLATAGGTATVNITAPATCNWSVSSNAAWISFAGATTGTGNGTVAFNYAANTTGAQLNSYITAQRQSLPVVQTSGNVSVLEPATAAINVAPTAEIPIVFQVSDEAGAADIQQIDFVIAGGGANQDCHIALTNGGGTPLTINTALYNNGANVNILPLGAGAPQVISSCTFDSLNSTFSVNGNIATVSLAMSFPAGFSGVHSIRVAAQNGGGTTTVPVPFGFLNVTTATPGTPTIILSPASGSQGATVPVTFIGAATNFTAGSTVTVSGAGVTASGVTFTSATSLAATLNVAGNAAPGAYTVTVTSGAEVDTATFTVTAVVVPTAVIMPSSGNQGATVPFTIKSNVPLTGNTGIDTFTVNNLAFVDGQTLTGSLVIPNNFATGPVTVTLTSGTQTFPISFTVNAANAPAITINPASGTTGSTVPVTITGTNTAFTTGSTIAASDPTITFANVTFVSATSLTATMSIAANSVVTTDMIVVTSGAEVDTTPFTVNPGLAPTITTTPAVGGVGATVPIVINGSNTNFSIASALSLSGTGVSMSNINTMGSGVMTGDLIISPNAAPGPYVVTITSGRQVVSTRFMVVNRTQTASTIAASSATLLPSQSLTLTANVTPANGTTKPTGLVTFVEVVPPAITLASPALNAGLATYTITKPSIGQHYYYANYNGDNASFNSSTSANVSVSVAQAAPGVSLSGVPGGILYPASAEGLTFSVALTGTSGVTPTGSVVFKDGGATLGTVTVANGAATLPGVNLGVGIHSITASYGGDVNFTPTQAASQPVAVQDFALAASPSTLTASGTNSYTSTMTITPGLGGFTQPIALSCSGAPANSTCTIAPSTATPGTANATAVLTIGTIVRPAAAQPAGMALLLFSTGYGFLLIRRRRSALRLLGLLLMLAGGAGAMTGCGSSTPPVPGTPVGSYALTVTATAGGAIPLTHTSTVTLVVK